MNRARIRTPSVGTKRYSKGSTNLRERLLAVIVLILLIWVTAGPFGLFRLYRLKEEQSELKLKKEEINKRIISLKDEIESLTTNRELQEKLVKSELGWVRDNELLYIFREK